MTILSDPVSVSLDRMSIVLVGSFNPSIFHPAWFARHEILRGSETEEANLKMVNPQLAQFNTEWLELQVTRERFQAVSRNGGYEGPLRDLVVSTFTRLEHTPITAVGMNREVQLQIDSVERWHRFGHAITPKDIWSDILASPGLVVLQMQGTGSEKDDRVNVSITNTGERKANIEINDHRQSSSPETAAVALKVLHNSWDDSQKGSANIVRHFLKLIEKLQP